MSDLAAAEGEAEATADAPVGPRIGTARGAVLAFAGSAALSFLLTLLAVWVETGGPLWVVVAGALAYSLALLVWAGSWKRPLPAAAIIASSLAGLLVGYLLAIVVSNLVDTRPDV